MRVVILGFILFSQGALWAATSKPVPSTCVDLQGNYVLPLGKHDRTDDPPILMIDQDHCRLISVVTGYGGFIPIGSPSSLDGSEGFFIVGDTIVEKGNLTIPTAKHGECSAQQITMALDADKNLIFSSPRVSGCEDKYKGALHDVFPRVGWVKPAPVPTPTPTPTPTPATSGVTCTDSNGRSVAISGSSFTFQNLDSSGLPSGKTFAINGSHYVEVPGGPEYTEYSGAMENVNVVVRLSKTKSGNVAEIWPGKNSNGAPAFKGNCSGSL